MAINPHIEKHKSVTTVKNFASRNAKNADPQYRMAVDVASKLLYAYEQNVNYEYKQRSIALIRLITEQLQGVLQDVLKDESALKKLKSYLDQAIDDQIKKYFKDENSFRNIKKEIRSAVRNALRQYKDRFKTKTVIVQQDAEQTDLSKFKLNKRTLKKQMDLASNTPEFLKFQEELGQKIDAQIDKSLDQKTGFISKYRNLAVKFAQKMVEKHAKDFVDGKISFKRRSLVGGNVIGQDGTDKDSKGKKDRKSITDVIPDVSGARRKRSGIIVTNAKVLRRLGVIQLRKNVKRIQNVFGKFFNTKFVKKVYDSVKTFLKNYAGKIIGGVAAVGFIGVLGIFKSIMFLAGPIIKIGKAIGGMLLYAIKSAFGIVWGVLSGVGGFVYGTMKGIYNFLTKNTIGKIVTGLILGSGGFILGYYCGILWKRYIEPFFSKIPDFVTKKLENKESGIGKTFDSILKTYKALTDWSKARFSEIGEFAREALEIYDMFADPIRFLFGLDPELWKTIYKTVMMIQKSQYGLGGRIASSLPGIWKFVGYVLNLAFMGLSKQFKKEDGRIVSVENEDYFKKNYEALQKMDYSKAVHGLDKDKIDLLNKKRNLFMSEYIKVISLNDRFQEVYDHAKKAREKNYPLDMKLLGGDNFWGSIFHTKIGGQRVDFHAQEAEFWNTQPFDIDEQYKIARTVMNARLGAFKKYNAMLLDKDMIPRIANVSISGDARAIRNAMREGVGIVGGDNGTKLDEIPSVVVGGSDYHKDLTGQTTADLMSQYLILKNDEMPKLIGRDVKIGEDVTYDSDSPDAKRIQHSRAKTIVKTYGVLGNPTAGG